MANASEEKSDRWQTDGSTVLERNKHMFNNPVMSDIKFAFPNKQTIPAHKYVLAISSPVFFAMFYGDLAEERESIDITDCDPEVFLQFLRYLYYDDTNFPAEISVTQLLYLADKYDVPSLSRECVNFMDAFMDPLNAFDIIPHARRFNHQNLEEICWEVIDYNAQQIAADDSFLEVEHEFLLDFLKRPSLCIKETMLFEAVDRWVTKRCEESSMSADGANKRSVLGEDLLKHIRFPLMSPQEFSSLVKPTEILSQREIIDVFEHFTSVPISGGIKFSILPRIEKRPSHACSMGNIYPKRCGLLNRLNARPSPTRLVPKSGILTFMVSKAIMLCGVKLITGTVQREHFCHVISLSIARRGQKIKQIKDKSFSTENDNQDGYEEINVFFNRPFRLEENACYTIETETDTTQNNHFFVWSEKSEESLQQSTSSINKTSNILSGHCSGIYSDCIPTDRYYKGEIKALHYCKE